MALEDILEAIRRDADQTVAGIIAEANAKAGTMLQRARDEADDEAARLAHSRDDDARLAVQRITSRAHLESARERRAAREHVYQAALDRAEERLATIRDTNGYAAILGRLFDEAYAVLPTAEVVRVDPSDADRVRAILDQRDLDLPVESTRPCWGGVELACGGRSVRNDLESRLRRADDHLRSLAGELLPDLRRGGT